MALSVESSSAQHISRLDVLRAAAFLAVFTFHISGSFPFFKLTWTGVFLDYSAWPKETLFLLPVSFGWLGVALFFVLSGFCIHYSTLRRKTAFTTPDFYWRRFLRIYPAYIVCLIVVTILSPWLPIRYFNFWQIASHVLMVHNFFKATFFGLNGVLWSLGVETQFYLLYPLLIYLVHRRMSWSQCLVMALIFNIFFQIYFSLTAEAYAMTPVRTTWSFPLVTWCDWILGACLAEAYVKKEPVFRREGLWLAGSGIMLIIALNIRTLNVQAYLFSSVFFAVLMQRYLSIQAPLNRIERGLVPVGLVSYSLYLWHQPILLLLDEWASAHHLYTTPLRQAFIEVVAGTAFLAPIAVISYYLFEIGAPAWIRAACAKRELAAVADAT